MNPEMSWIGSGISIDKESQLGFNSRVVEVDFAKAEDTAIAMLSKPAKPFPKVGDTIQIRHQVKRNKQGEVLGLQRADGKPDSKKITAVYMDGTVRSGNSDTWHVRPATNNTWETINPDREEW